MKPAAMMDGVPMAWQTSDMERRYTMSICQRDCFDATFSNEVRAMQYTFHQIGFTLMSKMTTFSRRFQRRGVFW